jgi:glutaredoxin
LRIETLLKAQGIKYQLVDLATDEHAKKVWRWRGKGRKLPGVVRVEEDGEKIVGAIEELEEANEYGELKQLVFKGGN